MSTNPYQKFAGDLLSCGIGFDSISKFEENIYIVRLDEKHVRRLYKLSNEEILSIIFDNCPSSGLAELLQKSCWNIFSPYELMDALVRLAIHYTAMYHKKGSLCG